MDPKKAGSLVAKIVYSALMVGIWTYRLVVALAWLGLAALASLPIVTAARPLFESLDFYSTAAQAIPTIIIAWVLETRALARYGKHGTDVDVKLIELETQAKKPDRINRAMLGLLGVLFAGALKLMYGPLTKLALLVAGFAEVAAILALVSGGAPSVTGYLVATGLVLATALLFLELVTEASTKLDAGMSAGMTEMRQRLGVKE